MSDYTEHEIDEAANFDYIWEELGADYGWLTDHHVTLSLRGEDVVVKRVAGKAPEEGGGENIWTVIQVGNQFFKKTGWYASHDGSYWDGSCTEVHPVERTVTFYE